MLKNIFLVVFISFVVLFETSAQSYTFSLGGRGGFANGLTAKYFIGENKAIEGIFTRRYRGYTFTAIYEMHKNLKTENLTWFYGLGGHIASYSSYYYYGYNRFNTYTYKNHVYKGYYSEPISVLGIDAIIGLEYRFKEIPFTIGIDAKPFFDLVGGGDNYVDAAASIRYIIK